MRTQDFRQLCKERNFNDDQIHEFELAISHGLNISLLVSLNCNAQCMHEIILGMMHHVDVAIYADNKFDWESMRIIRLGLEARYNMIPYATGDFSAQQLKCIYEGLQNCIDVSVYAKLEYSVEKMYQCLTALTRYADVFKDFNFDEYNEMQLYQLTEVARLNLPIDVIANPKYNDGQMKQLCLGLHAGLKHLDLYSDPEFSAAQMNQIRIGLEHNVDVKVYADPSFDAFQMKEIRLGLEQNLDVSMYADKAFTGKIMSFIRFGLLEGLEVSEYAIPGIEEDKAEAIYKRLMELQTSLVGDNPNDYEVGDAYIKLLGWGTEDQTELSSDLATSNDVVGIANPQFSDDASNKTDNNTETTDSVAEIKDTLQDSGQTDAISANESAEATGDSENDETEIPVFFDNVNEEKLNLDALKENKSKNPDKVTV